MAAKLREAEQRAADGPGSLTRGRSRTLQKKVGSTLSAKSAAQAWVSAEAAEAEALGTVSPLPGATAKGRGGRRRRHGKPKRRRRRATSAKLNQGEGQQAAKTGAGRRRRGLKKSNRGTVRYVGSVARLRKAIEKERSRLQQSREIETSD